MKKKKREMKIDPSPTPSPAELDGQWGTSHLFIPKDARDIPGLKPAGPARSGAEILAGSRVTADGLTAEERVAGVTGRIGDLWVPTTMEGAEVSSQAPAQRQSLLDSFGKPVEQPAGSSAPKIVLAGRDGRVAADEGAPPQTQPSASTAVRPLGEVLGPEFLGDLARVKASAQKAAALTEGMGRTEAGVLVPAGTVDPAMGKRVLPLSGVGPAVMPLVRAPPCQPVCLVSQHTLIISPEAGQIYFSRDMSTQIKPRYAARAGRSWGSSMKI